MKQVCKLKKKAMNSFVQVKVAWLDFSRDTYLPSLSIYYVAINKSEKVYHSYKFTTMYVLMTSELPWQRNDAMTFFTCFVFLGTMRFFFHKSFKGACTSLGCLVYGNIRTIFSDRFGNILKKSFKGQKNSE